MRFPVRAAPFSGVRAWRIGCLCAGLLALGCTERDRLTFPDEGGGVRPQVVILDPGQDTTVTAGPAALVRGMVTDPAGIDTVRLDVQGGLSSFPPLAAEGDDTVTFQLPITTTGLAGTTITVRISAINLDGVVSDTAVRHITIQ